MSHCRALSKPLGSRFVPIVFAQGGYRTGVELAKSLPIRHLQRDISLEKFVEGYVRGARWLGANSALPSGLHRTPRVSPLGVFVCAGANP